MESLEKARQWCATFAQWYNEENKRSTIKFVTPAQRHRGDDVKMLADRDELYRQAKAANSSRWGGSARNWQRSDVMVLNPDNEQYKLEKVA